MKHRSYRGKVSYITDGVGELGREMFYVTIQPDGTRTMRATCELDDDRLLRDVVATVDKEWYPLDAFVRLTSNETTAGSSWFRFTKSMAECEAITAKEGRVHQVFDIDERVRELGTHPVHADAWGLAQVNRNNAGPQAPSLRFSTSTQADGGSGPLLVPSTGRKQRRYIGRETIRVAAGTFEVEHFQDMFPDKPPSELWVTGEDYIPVRVQWSYRKQTYELTELSGDAR
ncbi:MAG: hypothetical protein EXR11_05955 [Rhodospirillaceae bacterium]|nr:hypothetical protein [Rhodospirillaceae bacterium]